MQFRLPSLLNPPIAFAHRGARAEAAENTLESFQLALSLGATGIESDVWLTSDGVAVLDHDGIVRRWGKRHAINTLMRDSLPSHIPSLVEMLRSCPGEFDLSLDIKDPLAVESVLETVRLTKPELEKKLWLCHPDWRIVSQWRDLTTARLVDSTRLARLKEGPERRAATLSEHGIDCINMHHTDWNAGLVALFHRFNRLTFGWDMQYDYVLDAGFDMGLDGVFSDHTQRMMQSLGRPS